MLDFQLRDLANGSIKGIGPAKRKALLQKFGSVENIKNASIEEIMKVRGITEEIARELKEID